MQTTTEMVDLIERVQLEVTRLVPASAPWEWTDDQTGTGCVHQKTGQKSVSRNLRSLVARYAFNDPEWEVVFPVVRELATEVGLTDSFAPQNRPGNHDLWFSSDDGRTLIFGSRVTQGNVSVATAGVWRSADKLRVAADVYDEQDNEAGGALDGSVR